MKLPFVPFVSFCCRPPAFQYSIELNFKVGRRYRGKIRNDAHVVGCKFGLIKDLEGWSTFYVFKDGGPQFWTTNGNGVVVD